MIDDIEIRPGGRRAARGHPPRRPRPHVRDCDHPRARHGLAGVASLRTQHTVNYITERVQGQAGLAGSASKGSSSRSMSPTCTRARTPPVWRSARGDDRRRPPYCRSSVLGLICDLRQDHDREVAHHLVLGHCRPTDDRRPRSRTRAPTSRSAGLAGSRSCPGTGSTSSAPSESPCERLLRSGRPAPLLRRHWLCGHQRRPQPSRSGGRRRGGGCGVDRRGAVPRRRFHPPSPGRDRVTASGDAYASANARDHANASARTHGTDPSDRSIAVADANAAATAHAFVVLEDHERVVARRPHLGHHHAPRRLRRRQQREFPLPGQRRVLRLVGRAMERRAHAHLRPRNPRPAPPNRCTSRPRNPPSRAPSKLHQADENAIPGNAWWDNQWIANYQRLTALWEQL